MVTDNITARHIKELLRRYPDLEKTSEKLIIAYSILKNCFFNDRILFVCGNGGSAADSEHIVGELMKGFRMKRPSRKLSVLILWNNLETKNLQINCKWGCVLFHFCRILLYLLRI